MSSHIHTVRVAVKFSRCGKWWSVRGCHALSDDQVRSVLEREFEDGRACSWVSVGVPFPREGSFPDIGRPPSRLGSASGGLVRVAFAVAGSQYTDGDVGWYAAGWARTAPGYVSALTASVYVSGATTVRWAWADVPRTPAPGAVGISGTLLTEMYQ